jgi:ADP-ribose pyrophosphatase
MKWEIVDRTLCYQGFFRIEQIRLRHSLYNGGQSGILVRELIQRSDAVAILPYDPRLDCVLLIEQFRTGAIESPQGPWMVEIIAGLIEVGEDREQTIFREAWEEAGCELQALHHLYDYYSTPGGFKERVSLYVAKVDSSTLGGIHGRQQEGEDIRIRVVGADEAFDMISSGLITSAMPIIALQWLQLNRELLRDMWG